MKTSFSDAIVRHSLFFNWKFNSCHGADGRFCSGGAMSTAVGSLAGLANTDERKKLVKAFEDEFPKAMSTIGLTPDDAIEITVFGSFASSGIAKPNDLDIIVKVPNSAEIPMGGLFDMTAWPQGEHKVPVAFAKPAIYNSLVKKFSEGIEDKVKVDPIVIYSK